MTAVPPSSTTDEPEWLATMEAVLEVLNEGVVITNENHRILFANARFVEMTGIPRPDLVGSNRANLAATIANARGMLEENRPQIKTTLHNVNAVSEKLQPLLEDFRKTSEQANQTLNHVDAMVGENREDVRQAVVELRRTLTNMTDATARLDQTLDVNSENIDELLDNMRHVTEKP